MNIITFGTDEHMLDANSRQYQRLLSYTTLVDGYTAVIFSKNSQEFKVTESDKLRVVQVPKKGLSGGLRKLYTLLKTKLPKETLISSQDPFEVGFLAYIFCKLLRVPLHVQVHTAIESPYFKNESLRNRIQYILSLFILRRAKAIRVVSDRIKKFIQERLKVSSDKIFVAPIFAGDLKTETVDMSAVEKENMILMMSRIEKVKNIQLGIEGFLQLIKKDAYKDYVLEIVGGGSQKMSLTDTYKQYSNIIWRDWTKEPGQEYQRAKVFLSTSSYEGWGMAPIEAVSLGVPVVMTNTGCANECIFADINGQIVYTFTSNEVAERLEKVLGNLDQYNPEKLRQSLESLPTQEKTLDILMQSFKKALL
ncbi:MAG: hypothetical protein RJB39_776 [Candidatus Parcubacteria bacterium]|jgi:glycosyltransferase involved in cell wall biosynthesis